MVWGIASYAGVGPILFGQNRTLVRQFFEEESTEFYKSASDAVTTDYFKEAGVFVFYDKADSCEAVEFTKPATVKWREQQLMPLPLGEVLEFMRSQDEDLEEDESGFTSYKNGIGGYTEDIEELTELAETIICFRQGYYSVGLAE